VGAQQCLSLRRKRLLSSGGVPSLPIHSLRPCHRLRQVRYPSQIRGRLQCLPRQRHPLLLHGGRRLRSLRLSSVQDGSLGVGGSGSRVGSSLDIREAAGRAGRSIVPERVAVATDRDPEGRRGNRFTADTWHVAMHAATKKITFMRLEQIQRIELLSHS
jgi:hypothetical protein